MLSYLLIYILKNKLYENENTSCQYAVLWTLMLGFVTNTLGYFSALELFPHLNSEVGLICIHCLSYKVEILLVTFVKHPGIIYGVLVSRLC